LSLKNNSLISEANLQGSPALFPLNPRPTDAALFTIFSGYQIPHSAQTLGTDVDPTLSFHAVLQSLGTSAFYFSIRTNANKQRANQVPLLKKPRIKSRLSKNIIPIYAIFQLQNKHSHVTSITGMPLRFCSQVRGVGALRTGMSNSLTN
jgi:hypothetical protein